MSVACTEMCVYVHSVYMRYKITSAKELRGEVYVCTYCMSLWIDIMKEVVKGGVIMS